MDENEIDLEKIGMIKGKQYETIVSTSDSENVMNAAPIGIICSGKDKVVCRIFKGGKTLDNILLKKEFVVNITHDPELFELSTVGNLAKDYFNDNNSIKNADAYFKCEVESFKEARKQSDPIKTKDEAIVIKSTVTELKIAKPVKAFNRAIGYVIESLANFSRFEIADDETKAEYVKRFKEAYRVVKKVGYPEDIKAMREIKKELINKGFDL